METAVHCILGACRARNRHQSPAGPSPVPRGALAPQRPQAAEHRTDPWTHFKHARSGLGEPGARAQSACDNDSDDHDHRRMGSGGGRPDRSAYNLLLYTWLQGIIERFEVCHPTSTYLSHFTIPFISNNPISLSLKSHSILSFIPT